jgi:hypothetical protein
VQKTTISILFISILAFLNCTPKSQNTSELQTKLIGYWISSNPDYQVNNPEKATVFYYGEIGEDGFGKYLQGTKELKYRVTEFDESQQQIKIAIRFTETRERIETLKFSNNFNRIKNNLVTPDHVSIDTYFVRK